MATSEMTGAQEDVALPSYEDFISNSAVVGRIHEINRFTFTVRHQTLGALTKRAVVDDLLAAALASLGSVLPRVGIHYLHALNATSQAAPNDEQRLDSRTALVKLTLDSRQHFSLSIFDDRLMIQRESSSFRDFYDWYCRFMPQAESIVEAVHRAIEQHVSHGPEIVEIDYQFKLCFADFARTGITSSSRETRNVDVLQTLIPWAPNDGNRTELAKQEFYRLDLNLSRLDEFVTATRSCRRNCWYTLEAPFNERGRFLMFTAAMKNSSIEILSHARSDAALPEIAPFDPDFTDDFHLALIGFFRDRALEGFLGPILENWSFTTQRQI